MRHQSTFYILSTVFILCCGCASYPVNPPLQQIDDNLGYRMNNRTLGETNTDELFVILSLSGGGTRAVALDYDVLKCLDQIQFGQDNRSLLDEVDLISSSSASSIPAAYYGLFGQETFLNDFAEDVLSYQAIDKRPYIHLLDSGISDNIGIRTPQLVFRVAGQIDRVKDGTIKKLVVIMVDAKTKTYFKGDLKARPPGAITSIA